MSAASFHADENTAYLRRLHRDLRSTQASHSLRDIFVALWRRRFLIFAFILVGSTLAALINALVPPRYTAHALLLVEEPIAAQGALSDFTSSAAPNLKAAVQTLRSPAMAREVIERLNLTADPAFNPRLQDLLQSKTAQQNSEKVQGFKNLSVNTEKLKTPRLDLMDAERGAVFSTFRRGLRVKATPKAGSIHLRFTAADPEKAALIVNALADTYINQHAAERMQQNQIMTGWLANRLKDLRLDVQAAEEAVARHRAKYNLMQTPQNMAASEDLLQRGNALSAARTQKSTAEEQLKQLALLSERSSGSGILFSTGGVTSEALQQLQQDDMALARKFAALSGRYGPKHPQMIQLNSERAALRKAAAAQIEEEKKAAQESLELAEARIEMAEKDLAEAAGENHENYEALAELGALTREAEAAKTVYTTFLESYKRQAGAADLAAHNLRVVSYAGVPSRPSFPDRTQLFGLGAGLGLLIGLVVALFGEQLNNTVRSVRQLESLTGYPCYALVPTVKQKPSVDLGSYVLQKPSSSVAESIRTLRMVMNLRAPEDRKPKAVTVTSSFPNEGKTTMSVWLGRLAAKSGEKVIVIDCDLRRPNIHRRLGKENKITLVEYLTGQSKLEDVVQKDDPSGVHIIYGRAIPNSALDLISGSKMKKFVESLKQAYDLVILDTPACLAVAEARVLASMSDQTLYAVSWDDTPREIVQSGIKQFSDMGVTALATVLMNVDLKRHLRYGNDDAVYYYGAYKEYYSD